MKFGFKFKENSEVAQGNRVEIKDAVGAEVSEGDVEKIEAIHNVSEDFTELYSVLDRLGGISNIKGNAYLASELKMVTEGVRGGIFPVTRLTRACNYRDKVIELLDKEGNEKYKKFEKE